MAEEVQYGTDSLTNKRKYEDHTTPPLSGGARRTTGFSAPIKSQSPPDSGNAPPTSYNSVPPPMDDFQLAKQRAQEIAARIFSSAEAKRPRIENGGSGFDSTDSIVQKSLISNMTPSSLPASYGYPGASKRIDVPNGRVGVIIGKAGETIKYLQLQSGAKIQVTRDMEADLSCATRPVELTGTPDQIAKAEQLIQEVLSEAEAGGGGSGLVNRRVPGQQYGEPYVTKIPNNKVGLVIGKGGETIKNMQATSGARIQVIPLHLSPGDPSTERTLQIDGTSEQIEVAKQMVNEVISQIRPRNPGMGGGYSQQGYQTTPSMQQSGYGYVQPGMYPTTAPQYNVPQQSYPGYPQPASVGYATGWDPTTGAPNQQTSQGGGYDYYTQQQQQATSGSTAPVDNATYGYTQPPAQGQGYPQEGYGGGYQAPVPQPGYGQPQTNPAQGYDQQQVYTSTQGDTSQTPQGYTAASPNPASYPPQGSTQPGYGVHASQPGHGTQPPSGYVPNYGLPQSQKPPAYGQQQPQQSPTTAQGGYAQPGYPQSQGGPPSQVGYAQPDSGGQQAPPSSYSTAGYGTLPYGQPGYGQPPPPHSSSYGGGYSQPQAYSLDAAPGSQAVPPGGVTKASPQS